MAAEKAAAEEPRATLQLPLTLTVTIVTVVVVVYAFMSGVGEGVVGAAAGAAAAVGILHSLWEEEERTELLAVAVTGVTGGIAGIAAAMLRSMVGERSLTGAAIVGCHSRSCNSCNSKNTVTVRYKNNKAFYRCIETVCRSKCSNNSSNSIEMGNKYNKMGKRSNKVGSIPSKSSSTMDYRSSKKSIQHISIIWSIRISTNSSRSNSISSISISSSIRISSISRTSIWIIWRIIGIGVSTSTSGRSSNFWIRLERTIKSAADSRSRCDVTNCCFFAFGFILFSCYLCGCVSMLLFIVVSLPVPVVSAVLPL
ncbi:uncharacterized protein LOC107676479 [Sinocyclocheilus anshuiensis]|uniref:uncharacterized protein LOC107676479 n=1 Tax=Sinocyclocheilus anshuiensis TaxID=1608454 RepID=UPI0007B8E972|nr:PREDICTED: uncharacterized protein LOC107676479 [Sinocyclocheilus anshuiensis]